MTASLARATWACIRASLQLAEVPAGEPYSVAAQQIRDPLLGCLHLRIIRINTFIKKRLTLILIEIHTRLDD